MKVEEIFEKIYESKVYQLIYFIWASLAMLLLISPIFFYKGMIVQSWAFGFVFALLLDFYLKKLWELKKRLFR